jgi:hypothetical protein
MNFKRLLNSSIGITLISIVLGLGLATLFRKVCTDKSCIVFNGPVISDVNDKIYKFGEKCYQYHVSPTTCDQNKKIVDIKSPEIGEEHKGLSSLLPGPVPANSVQSSNHWF